MIESFRLEIESMNIRLDRPISLVDTVNVFASTMTATLQFSSPHINYARLGKGFQYI